MALPDVPPEVRQERDVTMPAHEAYALLLLAGVTSPPRDADDLEEAVHYIAVGGRTSLELLNRSAEAGKTGSEYMQGPA